MLAVATIIPAIVNRIMFITLKSRLIRLPQVIIFRLKELRHLLIRCISVIYDVSIKKQNAICLPYIKSYSSLKIFCQYAANLANGKLTAIAILLFFITIFQIFDWTLVLSFSWCYLSIFRNSRYYDIFYKLHCQRRCKEAILGFFSLKISFSTLFGSDIR